MLLARARVALLVKSWTRPVLPSGQKTETRAVLPPKQDQCHSPKVEQYRYRYSWLELHQTSAAAKTLVVCTPKGVIPVARKKCLAPEEEGAAGCPSWCT